MKFRRRSWLAITRGGALGRIAAELGLQLEGDSEDVGLAAQLVGDHGRLAGDGGLPSRTARLEW
jgi:hypothetical protein